MIQQKKLTIEGEEYMITQFGAVKGVKLAKRVAKLAGPVLSAFVGQEEGLMAVIEKVLLSLDDVDFENLAVELMSGVTKNNMALNFDMEFAGRYHVLIKLMMEVIAFNYGSVFTLL